MPQMNSLKYFLLMTIEEQEDNEKKYVEKNEFTWKKIVKQ